MTALVPIEGWAARYDAADLNGDVIVPGALTPVRAKMLYQHAPELPIGRWLGFDERPQGLYAHGVLILAGPRQREIHALLRAGAIEGLSIGFRVREAARRPGGRRILAADLWEVSIVTFPMAPTALLTRIGAAHDAIPDDTPHQAGGALRRGAAALRAAAASPFRPHSVLQHGHHHDG